MADTIHKKRKDWPHFDTIHLSSDAYAEGYDRIFGRKEAENGKKKHETRRGRALQKASRKAAKKGSKKPQGSRRIHRSEEIRSEEV